MNLWYKFHNLLNKYEDPLTGKWLGMTSPIPSILIPCIYVYLVKIALPNYMRDRKPFEFRTFLVIYNFIQVIISTWLFIGLIPGGLDALRCYPDGSTISNHGSPEYTKAFTYYFHLSKYSDLIDTILFVLRKKYSQVTVLHVYHHSTMPFWTWMSVKYGPDGRLTYHAFLNAFVHVLMYTYYMLSALGPQFRKFLWWKRYLTMVQMMQFVLISIHAIESAIYGCNVSRTIVLLNGLQSFVYLCLFSNFFLKTYKKSVKREVIGDSSEVNGKNK